ncbi:MAG: FtsH protease activity modulator HflK [Pseudomonadales bacterium]|nr:FtsH protease activity modulator HflK [Pseudomonadales bacterium]
MAWNEPGGGNKNNQDPWRGKNDQGPPDLDEVLKKLQDRFGGLLGGGGNSGKNGGGGFGLIVLAAVVASIIWGVSGFYRVEQAENAVVLRFGEFHETVGAGLHWNPPLIDTIRKVDVIQINSFNMEATMLTEDQNLVAIGLVVQYKVNNPTDFFLESSSPQTALRHSTESALRHVVGGTKMDSVITEGRGAMAVDVQRRLQEYLNRYRSGLLVTKVNIEDAHPPNEVKAAFDDVIKAKEDEERVQNEAETYANGILPEAGGQARRMKEEALAYKAEVVSRAAGEAARFEKLLAEYSKAPEVTRRRLYLETMEQVYANTSKVVVDVEGGNNMMYLPLDKMMAGGAIAGREVRPSTATSQQPVTTSDGSSDLRGLDRLRQVRENKRWEAR